MQVFTTFSAAKKRLMDEIQNGIKYRKLNLKKIKTLRKADVKEGKIE